MSKVIVNGKTVEYAPETTLEQVAKDFQKEYDAKIVLAFKDRVLREMFRTVGNGGKVEFATVADPIGNATYQRSVIFMMIKAFIDVAPELVKSLYVDFQIGNGIYCRLFKGEIAEETVKKVKERMREIVKEDIPFSKETIPTRKAVSVFEKIGLKQKSELFRYRRASSSNIYHLDNCTDYYYAYIVASTGYLDVFDLFPYKGGLILQTPEKSSPNAIRPYVEKPKLFKTMYDSTMWCEALGLNAVGELNDAIVAGKATDLILLQEAIMEKQIGDIAAEIQKSGKRIVMIAGPSSSGKTTSSMRLSVQLRAVGLNPHAIACDDYFKNRVDYPKDENGEYDFESIDCVDSEFLTEQLNALLRGETISLPTYDFTIGERVFKGKTLTLGKNDVVVLEGIHCLNEALTPQIPREDKYKIYISALTQLNIDEHNFIPTPDGRLLRRIVRDARTRGYSAQDTIQRWQSVLRGEEKNIFPYQEEADVMINSALIYELAVLKPYLESALFSVPQDSKEYPEAKRLLKFLDYFLAIPSEEVPKNSLVREFIGGGIFDI